MNAPDAVHSVLHVGDQNQQIASAVQIKQLFKLLGDASVNPISLPIHKAYVLKQTATILANHAVAQLVKTV